MLRYTAIFMLVIAVHPALALEVEMAVPSSLEAKVETITVRDDYMVVGVEARSKIIDVLAAQITCKAQNGDGYTWSLNGRISNLRAGQPGRLNLISQATMEDYELATAVTALRCYAVSTTYGYLDLFP